MRAGATIPHHEIASKPGAVSAIAGTSGSEAERLSEVLHKAVPSLSEEQGEELGIFMAKNRDVFAKAFKSQPDALDELEVDAASE